MSLGENHGANTPEEEPDAPPGALGEKPRGGHLGRGARRPVRGANRKPRGEHPGRGARRPAWDVRRKTAGRTPRQRSQTPRPGRQEKISGANTPEVEPDTPTGTPGENRGAQS